MFAQQLSTIKLKNFNTLMLNNTNLTNWQGRSGIARLFKMRGAGGREALLRPLYKKKVLFQLRHKEGQGF